MANKFFESGERRAEKVNDLFAAVASRYDLINDLQSCGLHRLWKRRLVRLAGVGPGGRALDVCCGTGDVTLRLAKAGAETIGLDFSEAMLAVARQRLAAHQGGGAAAPLEVRFVAGDALQLPFPDSHFDAVTVAYGLRNLSSWAAGLSEMARVTRPGGRLVVLDFGKPDCALWRTLYFAYLRRVVPVFGRLFCGDAALYAYILESLQHYPAQHGVAAEMAELGCAEVRIVSLLGGMMALNFAVKGRGETRQEA